MIKLYSKSYCPFCDAAKNLLNSLNVDYEVVDVTNDLETFQKIAEKSGMMTVPQIFNGEECLGGYTDIEKLHNEGKLLEKLKAEDC